MQNNKILKTFGVALVIIYVLLLFTSLISFSHNDNLSRIFNFVFNLNISKFTWRKYSSVWLYFLLMPGVILAISQLFIKLPELAFLKSRFKSSLWRWFIKTLFFVAAVLAIYYVIGVVSYYNIIYKNYGHHTLGFFSGDPTYLSSKYLINWLLSLLLFPISLITVLLIIASKYGFFSAKALLGTDIKIFKNNYVYISIIQLLLIIMFCISANNILIYICIYLALLRSSYFKYKVNAVFLSIVTVALLSVITFTILYYAIPLSGDAISYYYGSSIHGSMNEISRFHPLIRWYYFFIHDKSIFIYFLQNVFVFFITIFALNAWLKLYKVKPYIIYVLVTMLIILIPDYFYTLSDLSYQEPYVGLFFVMFFWLWLFARTQKQQKHLYYMLALIPAVLATYMKEPSFVLSVVVGLGLIVFYRRSISKQEKTFAIMLLINACIFILGLYIKMHFNRLTGHAYRGTNLELSFNSILHHIANLIKYFTSLNNYLESSLSLLPVFLLVRLYYFISKRNINLLIPDMIFFTGIAYMFIIMFMMPREYMAFIYYFIPVFLCLIVAGCIYINYIYNLYMAKKIPAKLMLSIAFAVMLSFYLLLLSGIKRDIYSTVPLLPAQKGHIMLSRQLSQILLVKNLSTGKTFKLSQIIKPSDIKYIDSIAFKRTALVLQRLNFKIYNLINVKAHNYKYEGINYKVDAKTTYHVKKHFVLIMEVSYDKLSRGHKYFFQKYKLCSNFKVYFLGSYIIDNGLYQYIYLTGAPPKVKYYHKPELVNIQRCN